VPLIHQNGSSLSAVALSELNLYAICHWFDNWICELTPVLVERFYCISCTHSSGTHVAHANEHISHFWRRNKNKPRAKFWDRDKLNPFRAPHQAAAARPKTRNCNPFPGSRTYPNAEKRVQSAEKRISGKYSASSVRIEGETFWLGNSPSFFRAIFAPQTLRNSESQLPHVVCVIFCGLVGQGYDDFIKGIEFWWILDCRN